MAETKLKRSTTYFKDFSEESKLLCHMMPLITSRQSSQTFSISQVKVTTEQARLLFYLEHTSTPKIFYNECLYDKARLGFQRLLKCISGVSFCLKSSDNCDLCMHDYTQPGLQGSGEKPFTTKDP